MLIPGSRSASSFAVPVPNSELSWTITALFATLPAPALMPSSALMASSTHLPKPGFRRKTFFSPRVVMRSDAPTSTA
jgi:hypothetical protein